MREIFRPHNKIPIFDIRHDQRLAVSEHQSTRRGAVCCHPFPELRRLGSKSVLSEQEELVSLEYELLEAGHI
jgi:hypothetical protein